MAHHRQVIREAIKAALLNKTAAGARVYETRMAPWRPQELPALSVYWTTEPVEPESKATAPRELTRKVSMVVEGVVQLLAGGNVDDALDDLAKEIEKAMDADPYLGGSAADSILTSSDAGTMVVGNQPMGAVQLTYEVTYRTQAPDPADVTLDDLNKADVRFSLSGRQPASIQANDVLAAPAAPTSLAAVAAGIPAPKVDLSWAHTGQTETEFRIDRCVGAACTGFSEVARVGKSVLAYSDGQVVNGVTYRYRVVALAGEFESAASNIVQAVIP